MLAPSKEGNSTLPLWALEMGGCSALVIDARAPGRPVIEICPGFERFTGHAVEEYLGREYDFLQGPATDARTLEQLFRAVRLGVSTRATLRSHRKDGSSFWNEVTLATVLDARGEPAFMRVLQCDVTDKMEARGQLELVSTLLADRQKFTSAILEGIHAAIITADARRRVTFINRVACKILGVTPAQCLDSDLLHLLDLPGDIDRTLTEADRVRRLSYTLRRPDGQTMDIGLSMSRAFDDAHHDLGYFVVCRDLGDPMQFEVDLRRVERLAAMGTMVAGFAHEVRNPIATLRILTETLLGDSEPGDPALEYVTRMMQQIERIERLVKTSLQFGRPVAPRRASRPAGVIAAAALDAVAVRSRRSLGGAPRAEVAPDLPPVFADDAQVTQVLVILLENAIDAAGADRVTLRVRAPAHAAEVRFEVADEGPGIQESLLHRIFDPFFTTKPNGTGLGLSIAQQLIQENRGRIEVSSAEGRGTTFAVLVPRADREPAALRPAEGGSPLRDRLLYAEHP